MRLNFSLTSLALFSAAHAAIGPISNLYIVNQYIAPDGYNRSATLAGATAGSATMPGPLITATKGDSFAINVINELSDQTMLTTTTVHWHGIFQTGTNWEDGVAGVTQCPIIPGHSFLYQFTVADQAGTYWYHSHHSVQYCDGLRGALIIYDPDDPYLDLYDVDNESTVITLSDWYHYVATVAPTPGGSPNSTLINGLGRYSGDSNSSLAVVNITQGLRYRFRLISMSCFPYYNFSIDNHTMTVIETDGTVTEPRDVNTIQVFAGQRYSFILHANQEITNYWIRAEPNIGDGNFTNGMNSAILHYAGAPLTDPTTNQSSATVITDESDLPPLVHSPVPGLPVQGGADININLDVHTFNGTNFFVNNATFYQPTVPVLLQILSGAMTAQELLPSGSVYILPRNKSVEISIPGGGPGSPHPMHLHGQDFHVVRVAGSDTYNYVNPVKRDVVSAGESTSDNVTFRFTTNNPGPWILHCHIDWHLREGLAVVFATDVNATYNLTPPRAWDQLCPLYIDSGLE